MNFQGVPGHEFVGIVEEAPEETGLIIMIERPLT